MSRVGNSPITIPAGVTLEKTGKTLTVNGSKGTLKMEIDPRLELEVEGPPAGGTALVKRKNDLKVVKSMHGLTRNLISNMIKGVSEGWTKDLELVGVGFRAVVAGDKLTLNIGFSHQVEIAAPEGISFTVLDNTKIKVSGIDKYMVGQIAANIRAVRPPDVYKGKGIRYAGEYVKKKLGKSGKVAGAPGAGGAK